MEKKYGFWAFIWDVIMTSLTCGFWLIWIFVREMRKRNQPRRTYYTYYDN